MTPIEKTNDGSSVKSNPTELDKLIENGERYYMKANDDGVIKVPYDTEKAKMAAVIKVLMEALLSAKLTAGWDVKEQIDEALKQLGKDV